jgi:hypothetical protein
MEALMRYILIWWFVHPMHMQTIHTERWESEQACQFRAAQLQASTRETVHYHCSAE